MAIFLLYLVKPFSDLTNLRTIVSVLSFLYLIRVQKRADPVVSLPLFRTPGLTRQTMDDILTGRGGWAFCWIVSATGAVRPQVGIAPPPGFPIRPLLQ